MLNSSYSIVQKLQFDELGIESLNLLPIFAILMGHIVIQLNY